MTDNERKEAISALRQLLAMCDFVDQYGDFIDADPYFNAVETVIESLNKTRWIPCSERLPEYRETVLISTFWGVRVADRDAIKEDGTDDFWYMFLEDSTAHPRYVYAWMPLPEPYREDGEA